MATAVSSSPDLPAPMYERRSEWINDWIQEVVEYAGNGIPHRWDNIGSLEQADYELSVDPRITAFGLVERAETEQQRRLKILDIGPGCGGFILHSLKRGHEVHGLSLQDFRGHARNKDPELADLPDDVYLQGDAHDLHKIAGIRDDYDLIVSHMTFLHLVDSLSVVEQVVNRLGQGGRFAVDGFAVHNLHPMPAGSMLLSTLEEGGFVIEHEGHYDSKEFVKFSGLVVQRLTNDVGIRFPVQYAPDLGVDR